jgi:hypothetical protein
VSGREVVVGEGTTRNDNNPGSAPLLSKSVCQTISVDEVADAARRGQLVGAVYARVGLLRDADIKVRRAKLSDCCGAPTPVGSPLAAPKFGSSRLFPLTSLSLLAFTHSPTTTTTSQTCLARAEK